MNIEAHQIADADLQADALDAKAQSINISLAETPIHFAPKHPASALRNLNLIQRLVPSQFWKVSK
jgi:hypothetical protein